MLHRRVDELLHLGKGDDLVELGLDLGSPHAEDRTVQEDVLAPRELGMKAGAHVEQRPDATEQLRPALGGLGDAGRGS